MYRFVVLKEEIEGGLGKFGPSLLQDPEYVNTCSTEICEIYRQPGQPLEQKRFIHSRQSSTV